MARLASRAVAPAVALAFALACSAPPVHQASHSAPAERIDSVARAERDSMNRATPGYVVDSILPIAEELRRFREGLPTRPTALASGKPSRHALARAFVAALAARDTTVLRQMVLTRSEFAYLVYPSSPYTKPPYRQSPGLAWMQISTASTAGYSRLVDRLGGQLLAFEGVSCEPTPERQGENTVWRRCVVRVVNARGDAIEARLFGDILERSGSFKFVSYANDM